ncbi:unnamed protein product [Trichogramma brassicae]|uniref:Uncharacterized protein n=1 Tax=Trichogramma brassicae TaxID=86971 RepID=A0A6H5ILV1_9HYME|nr:unnamed protein product [Trichogramma brassicae]
MAEREAGSSRCACIKREASRYIATTQTNFVCEMSSCTQRARGERQRRESRASQCEPSMSFLSRRSSHLSLSLPRLDPLFDRSRGESFVTSCASRESFGFGQALHSSDEQSPYLYVQLTYSIKNLITNGSSENFLASRGAYELRATLGARYHCRPYLPNTQGMIGALANSTRNEFDMNYANEIGLTHFHVACERDCEDVVEKFLELGQDPNCLVPETGDSPLHLSLKDTNVKIFELLLRNGANPNLANINGSTPLHVIVKKTNSVDLARMLFELSAEKYQPLQIDARDKFGCTPLQSALALSGKKQTIEMLIRNGADPNSTNEYGSTYLHIICQSRCLKLEGNSLETLFEACDNTRQTLQVDAVDNLGRTPLQWAVANFLPRTVNLLLDRGADVSKFIFPTESYFGESFERWRRDDYKLRLVPGVLAVIECLERRGYELDQNGASTIMKFFFELKMFEKSVDLQECWYDDKDFASKARAIMIRDNDHESLSLYDLSRLPSVEAAKRLKYEDYYDFFCSFKLDKLIERHKLACTLHLCEKLSRGFFRRWALKLFMELTHYQLPILCCEKIIEKLMNQDLIHICLATTDQSH